MAEVIPVAKQLRPNDFHSKVGKKGAKTFAKHNPVPPVPGKFWAGKEHWRLALNDLYDSYGRVCAFTAIRIERVTGARSVEHFKPKSKYPQPAYVWSNFRLVCGLMNGRKGDHEDVLDPFELPPNTFDFNPQSGGLLVHRDCPAKLRAKAQATIKRLRLDDAECRKVRLEHVDKLFAQDWTLEETRRLRRRLSRSARPDLAIRIKAA